MWDDIDAAVNPQRKIRRWLHRQVKRQSSPWPFLTLEARHLDAGSYRKIAVRTGASLLLVATEIYPMVEINDYPVRFAPTSNVAPGAREFARAMWRTLADRRARNRRRPVFIVVRACLTDLYIAVVSRWSQQEHGGQTPWCGSVNGVGEQTPG